MKTEKEIIQIINDFDFNRFINRTFFEGYFSKEGKEELIKLLTPKNKQKKVGK